MTPDLCTLTPTRFLFQLQEYFWLPRTQIELPRCCCLEDGLKALLAQGTQLNRVVGAEFETPDGWKRFADTDLYEIRAVVAQEEAE